MKIAYQNPERIAHVTSLTINICLFLVYSLDNPFKTALSRMQYVFLFFVILSILAFILIKYKIFKNEGKRVNFQKDLFLLISRWMISIFDVSLSIVSMIRVFKHESQINLITRTSSKQLKKQHGIFQKVVSSKFLFVFQQIVGFFIMAITLYLSHKYFRTTHLKQ